MLTFAGGGSLAHTLAPTGKRILLLERGDFLPREPENWDPDPVFIQGRYISNDTWFDAILAGRTFVSNGASALLSGRRGHDGGGGGDRAG